MIFWQVKKDSISYRLSVKKEKLIFFVNYLHHRFRVLFAYSNTLVFPYKWCFSNGFLTLNFCDSILEQGREIHLSDKTYHNWEQTELIPLISILIKFHLENIFGFGQFFPVNGQLIPPVSFFIGNFFNHPYMDQPQADLQKMGEWVEKHKIKFTPFIHKEDLSFLDQLVRALNNYNIKKIKFLINSKKIEPPFNFLDLLTESEFFEKIRGVYSYQIASKSTVGEESECLSAINCVLELNPMKKDPCFGKLIRPLPQEIWETLVENSHTTKLLAITDKRVIPNPLQKIRKNILIVEWFGIHEDQPLLFIKKKGKIPKIGYLYAFEYGDIEQIQRKRKNINFAKSNKILQSFFKNNAQIIPKEKNLYAREELADIIINNKGFFAVQGPPGTGKTHLAAEIVTKLLINNPLSKILICAKEHLALDHLLKTIVVSIKGKNIPFLACRSMSSARYRRVSIDDEIKEFLMGSIVKKVSNYSWSSNSRTWEKIQKGFYKETDLRIQSLVEKSASILFCTTMDSLINRLITNKQTFDLVIIEEAGKCYPSELLHVLCLGQNVLMIGDQNQLPPYKLKQTIEAIKIWEKALKQAINNQKLDEELSKRFGRSYQNLRENFRSFGPLSEKQIALLKPFQYFYEHLPKEKTYMLDEQFRMEKSLSTLIANVFYNTEFKHKKRNELSLSGVFPKQLDTPLLWIDTPFTTKVPEAGEDPEKNGSRINAFEVKIIIAYLNKLSVEKDVDLVILTPYNDQKYFLLDNLALKNICKKLTKKSFDKIVKTTDEFQGNEASLTIISLVRNNALGSKPWGFVNETERLNVMFSRAKSHQVVVGCSEHIVRNKDVLGMEIFYKLLCAYKKLGIFIPAQELL